jgi:hypothetical protein
MRNKIAFLLFLCVLIQPLNVSALTGPEAPTYYIELDCGNKIFKMYSPWPFWVGRMQGQTRIVSDHLKTGLYYNTDPLTPIYLFNDETKAVYIEKQNLLLSDCGLYAVDFGWMYTDDGHHLLKAFDEKFVGQQMYWIHLYARGVLLRSHYWYNIVSVPTDFVIFTADGGLYDFIRMDWEDVGKRSFDAANNVLSFTSTDGLTTRIDITTGEIIGSVQNPPTGERPPRTLPSLSASALLCLAAIGILGSSGCIRARRRV